MVRRLYLLSIVFPMVFLLILSSFSTAGAQNGLCEQPMSSPATGDPVPLSLANSDLSPIAQPSVPLDPQAQAAIDAARASLEGNPLPSSSVFTTTNTWVNRSPANPPFARRGHALAYDVSAGKVILFGGLGWDGSPLNDTWAYDYSTNSWTNRNPTNPPPARSSHALAYNAAAVPWNATILFGGRNGINLLNDTWAYNYASNSWSNRNPASKPLARAEHALAYDTSADRVVLFGGTGWGGSDLNDTWAYDYAGNSWSNRNPASHPVARNSHALAYDASAGNVILFGGLMSGSGYLNGTWVYDYASNNWANRTPTSSPPSRSNHALAYDASAGNVILFGGWDGNNSLNDTWALRVNEEVSLSYNLTEGWNMISLPLTPASTNPQVVFGGLPSPWYLFEWDPLAGIYIGKELISLRLGAGYWLRVPTAVAYSVSGLPNVAAQSGINLGLNWNLIGVPYEGVIPWGAVRVSKDGGALVTLDQAVSSNWIQGMFFHWNDSTYDWVTAGGNFQPLFGYWAKTKVTGVQLVFLQP